MLDQSFSAKNFEVIHNLECRKGNVGLDDMPEVYQLVVREYHETRETLRALIQKPKSDRDEACIEIVAGLRQQIRDLKQRKDEALQDHLAAIVKTVNASDFRFEMHSFVADEGKEVFYLKDDFETLYAIKQLQHNISKTFKVKQANRHAILECIKPLLSSKIPQYVIRTDISGFYESIPQSALLHIVNDNTLLSYKSKSLIRSILNLYEQIKDTTRNPVGLGVPRGVGISSHLSEIYMRDIDAQIKSREEVVFYARYVDDIFIVCKSVFPQTLDQYYVDLCQLFARYGLTLKTTADPGNKCQLLDLTSDIPETSFDYLGYKLRISRSKSFTKTQFDLSDHKQDRLKARIDAIINHCENLACVDVKAAKRDLLDGLRLLSCNYSLSQSKSGVKVGLYYTNNLLDSMDGLTEVSTYLHGKILYPKRSILMTPSGAQVRYYAHLNRKIQKLDLVDAWRKKLFYPFEMKRLSEMEEWL